MVVWPCSEEELVYLKQGFFFSLCLFLKDENEALCKQGDTVTVQDYIS